MNLVKLLKDHQEGTVSPDYFLVAGTAYIDREYVEPNQIIHLKHRLLSIPSHYGNTLLVECSKSEVFKPHTQRSRVIQCRNVLLEDAQLYVSLEDKTFKLQKAKGFLYLSLAHKIPLSNIKPLEICY